MSRIEELNLNIPAADFDIQEQQRILIENFSLLRDLVITPGYLHTHRHKDTSDSLTINVWHQITGYSHKSSLRKKSDIDLSTGVINLEIGGVWNFVYFIHLTSAGTNAYEVAIRSGTTILGTPHSFDAHGGGGEAIQEHSIPYEFSFADEDAIIDDLNLAIRCTDASPTLEIVYFHLDLQRIDNYAIPN